MDVKTADFVAIIEAHLKDLNAMLPAAIPAIDKGRTADDNDKFALFLVQKEVRDLYRLLRVEDVNFEDDEDEDEG